MELRPRNVGLELRPYQLEAIDLLRASMKKHKNVVLCLPTGSGKSVIFSELVRLTAEKGNRCLVLTHRIELFDATMRHLSRHITPEIIQPGTPNPPAWSLVTVAMVETISRRLRKGLILDPRLIIIDEAHFGNFSKIIECFPQSMIIGVTATPVGKHFHKYYKDIVANIDIPELIQQGHLAPCEAYQMEDNFDDVPVVNGEFQNDSLYSHFDKRELYDGVINEYARLIAPSHRRTLVFNVNIEHTERMTDAFNLAGIPSRCVTSLTPAKQRAETLEAFHSGEFMVLNNCGILTTGYDEPSVSAIIMNRATLSLPLWLQCQGRGSRPHPGKDNFIVVDFGKNHDRHGLWCEARNHLWSLDPPKKRNKIGAAPIKTCPKCKYVMPAATMVCPGCEYAFPAAKVELKKNGVAVLQGAGNNSPQKRLSQCSINELADLQISGKVKYGTIWRVVRSRGRDAIHTYSILMRYKPGWVYRQIEEMHDCRFKDKVIDFATETDHEFDDSIVPPEEKECLEP